MKIRSANESDLDSLMNITTRCIDNLERRNVHQWDETYPSASDFKDDIEKQSLFVVVFKERVCGCICINQQEYPGYEKAAWSGSRFLVIHKLIVDTEAERQGLGSSAMHYAEQIIHKKKMDSLRLDCFKENSRANLFYQNLGYSIKGETEFRKGWFNLYEKRFKY